MLVADNYHLEAGGLGDCSTLFVFIVVCVVRGARPSWNKAAGGDTVARVVFEQLRRRHVLGISQECADVLIR